MKIKNLTHWRTDQLKAILSRVAREELSPEKRKQIVVTIAYTRKRDSTWSSGHASIGGRLCRVRLSKQAPDLIDFAFVAAHEFAHLRGLEHIRMPFPYRSEDRYSERARAFFGELIAGLPLEQKEVRKPKRPGAEEKLSNVRSLISKWEQKAKTAASKLRKYRAQERYYERRAAAKNPGEIS